ncbi:MAG: protoheme IX farnesyltransferase [Anaerolineae bacterium]|nr:protoheme IX farnesyltransferase [Anaerolineae bacterium]
MTATSSPSQRQSLTLGARLRAYWQLIKSLQTGLLLITAVAGFLSVCCPMKGWHTLLGLVLTLFCAISGSTVLNMVYDRDIDAKMARTARRPLPSGRISVAEALGVGLVLSAVGVGGALALNPLYGLIVLAGAFLDVVIYTIWLKRRTPWSILWGGLAGGMPVLAGRTLGMGQVETVGLLLALAVLLWIPTHIMTFGIKHAADYKRAGVPVFATVYGEQTTRLIISVSTVLAVIVMALAVWQIELHIKCVYADIGLGATLVLFTLISLAFPSSKLNFALFKFASLYMLGSMGLIVMGV